MRSDETMYIPPDYSHEENDGGDLLEDITDIDEELEDARIEKLLEDQSEFSKDLGEKTEEKKENNTSMGASFSGWGSSSNNGNAGAAPWEQNNQQQSTPSWGQSSGWGSGASRPANNGWGTGNSWGNSSPSWGNSGSSNSGNNNQTVDNTINSRPKKVVICDALDCLVESYDSNGKPGLIPRAIFDLKPKFDVWEKIASFNPERLYIIFPSGELIPSFGRPQTAKISLEYLAHSISTYLRIPRDCCFILKQMTQNLPKDRTLMSVLKDGPERDDMVYIGIHSGRWGLSARDIQAAHAVGIDYIDMYNLLKGYYEYE